MFKIIIRGWCCKDYLDRCVSSLYKQTEQDWHAVMVIDPSGDGTETKALGFQSDKISVLINDKRLGLTHNIVKSVSCGSLPGQIIGILDADDWLYPTALATVRELYRRKECLITYGSFILDETGEKSRICKPYPDHANVRTHKWRATHFKTFKYEVFSKIPEHYFLHNGIYIPCASDLALMIPMIECAGIERSAFCKYPIYHYRNHTPFSVDRKQQKKWEGIVRAKKPMKRRF